jgi:hypothetical protein
MTRPIKLRPQEADLPERKVRLRLPGRLAADLDHYCELYAQVHGHEIELPSLIEGILEQFLASDRAFQRSRLQGNEASRLQSVGSHPTERTDT